jgi:hypothetical protein
MLYIVRRLHWVLQVKDILEETCDWFSSACAGSQEMTMAGICHSKIYRSPHMNHFTTNNALISPQITWQTYQFHSFTLGRRQLLSTLLPLNLQHTNKLPACGYILKHEILPNIVCKTNSCDFFLFCTMTNKCTINWQIITLPHVSTLLCHPQEARSLVPYQVTQVRQIQLLVIQFKIKIFRIGFMQVLIIIVAISVFKTFKILKLPLCWPQMILAHFIVKRTILIY